MGPIIDAIWQLPWYKVLIVAVADDAMLLIKLWPLWSVIAVMFVLRVLYTWWDHKWGAKRRRKKLREKVKESTNQWKDNGTYYKRAGREEKR